MNFTISISAEHQQHLFFVKDTGYLLKLFLPDRSELLLGEGLLFIGGIIVMVGLSGSSASAAGFVVIVGMMNIDAAIHRDRPTSATSSADISQH